MEGKLGRVQGGEMAGYKSIYPFLQVTSLTTQRLSPLSFQRGVLTILSSQHHQNVDQPPSPQE